MKIKRIEIGVPPGVRARSHIVIIYTGGTFGMHYDARGVLIPFDFGGIRSHLPVIGKLGLDLTIFSFETPIDSSSVSPAHWKEMVRIISANYHVADGFVLLHGTDTMAYTASALSFMLGGLSKPVVLTGAQLPIAELRSDGRENLIAALEVASARWRGQAAVPEVCIYFNYQLLRGNRARKVQSMQFDAFDSGNYPLLARAGVKIDYNRTVIRKPGARLQVRTAFDRNVSLLKLYPGITASSVRATLGGRATRGVVLETFGSGNVPDEEWLYEVLQTEREKGKILLNISQCPGGSVVQGRYESGKRLREIGVLGGADMTTEAAITKMMFLLGEYGPDRTRRMIVRPLAGEMTV